MSDVRSLGYRLSKSLEQDLNSRAVEMTGEPLFVGSLREQTLKAWINGDSWPDAEVTEIIANVLGVDPAWLAFGSGTKAPAPHWWKEGK